MRKRLIYILLLLITFSGVGRVEDQRLREIGVSCDASKGGKKKVSKDDLKKQEQKKNAGASTEKKKDLAKVDKGLAYLHSQERKLDTDNDDDLTKEEAEKAAKRTKAKHRIFKSIKVVDKGNSWGYKYSFNPTGETGGKKKDVHRDYKPKVVKIEGSAGVFKVFYQYEVEVGGKKEKRNFTSTLKLLQGNKVSQSTRGTNLALSNPGRGYTASANQKASNKAIESQKKDEYKGKQQAFDAAHVLADVFLGSGYKNALNLITTSRNYNQVEMRGKEDEIRALVKRQQKLAKKRGQYVTFDMNVEAHWNAITDSIILNTLKSKDQNLDQKHLEKLRNKLSKDKDPKVVQKTIYTLETIYFRNLNGEVATTKQLNTSISLGPDTELQKTIK